MRIQVHDGIKFKVVFNAIYEPISSVTLFLLLTYFSLLLQATGKMNDFKEGFWLADANNAGFFQDDVCSIDNVAIVSFFITKVAKI